MQFYGSYVKYPLTSMFFICSLLEILGFYYLKEFLTNIPKMSISFKVLEQCMLLFCSLKEYCHVIDNRIAYWVILGMFCFFFVLSEVSTFVWYYQNSQLCFEPYCSVSVQVQIVQVPLWKWIFPICLKKYGSTSRSFSAFLKCGIFWKCICAITHFQLNLTWSLLLFCHHHIVDKNASDLSEQLLDSLVKVLNLHFYVYF